MEIPTEFVAIGSTALVGLQAWTLAEVVKLKTQVAVIAATCEACETPKGKYLRMNKKLLSLFVGCSLLLGTGCASLYTKTATPPVVTTQPVFGVVTNDGGALSIGQIGTTNLVSTGEVWQVNSNLSAALQTAQAVNSVVPSPAQPFVALGLGLFSTLVTVFAGYKTRRLTATNAALTAVVAGVEVAGDVATKLAIARASATNGSATELDTKVQQVSGNLPASKPVA